MNLTIILLLIGIGLTAAQVPGFGGCPEFESQQDFDMNKFLGTWYEAERYVNIFEAGTRCVKTNYSKTADGRFLVANEITNRFTNVKRVLEGEVRLILKGSESKLNVRYPNLPIPYESQLMVLDTDYNSYSVMWSCSSLGIINTQNAWILTREKLAPGTVVQKAYDILDKYKLSRTFFFKTDQNSCELIKSDQGQEHGNAASTVSNSGSKKPAKKVSQKKNGQVGSGNREETQPKVDEAPTESKQQSHQQQSHQQQSHQQQPHQQQPHQHHQQEQSTHSHQQSNQHHHHSGPIDNKTPPLVPVSVPVPVPAPSSMPASTSSNFVPVVTAAAPVANDNVGHKIATSNV